MSDAINLPLILLAALAAVASPGPATITIAETAMSRGKAPAFVLVLGILTGSLFWSISASLGVAALMLAHGWALDLLRILGAGYLLFLAAKSAGQALGPDARNAVPPSAMSTGRMYLKGLVLHLTNPKAILFFGSLFAIGLPAGTSSSDLALIVAALAAQSFLVFTGYALLFSNPIMARGYLRMRRGLQGLFAIAFAGAGIKVLTTRLV